MTETENQYKVEVLNVSLVHDYCLVSYIWFSYKIRSFGILLQLTTLQKNMGVILTNEKWWTHEKLHVFYNRLVLFFL